MRVTSLSLLHISVEDQTFIAGKSRIPANTEILFGDTPTIITCIKDGHTNLQWAQSTWAGELGLSRMLTLFLGDLSDDLLTDKINGYGIN